MTVRQVYDQNIILRKLGIDLLKGLLHAGLSHVFALFVQIFKFCCQRFCPGMSLLHAYSHLPLSILCPGSRKQTLRSFFSAQQQFQCQLCGLQPSACV